VLAGTSGSSSSCPCMSPICKVPLRCKRQVVAAECVYICKLWQEAPISV
jgi:hypothetical protein